MGFRRILLLCVILLLTFRESPGQAILSERIWTNADGKKLKAELLKFGREAEDGLVRLRVKGGSVFTVDQETLSRSDQAVILKARIDHFFRSKYSGGMDAHFFYSRRIAREKELESTVAYIGSDVDGAWLRLKVSVPTSLADEGVALMLMGKGADSIRVDFEEEDIDRRRGRSIIDISLTDRAADFGGLLARPAGTRLVVMNRAGIYTEVKLSSEERAALKEVGDAFATMHRLSDDLTWWSVFQDLDAEEVAALRKKDEPVAKPPKGELLGDPKTERGIIPEREWMLASTGESFVGKVVGFDRHRIRFEVEGGGERVHPLEELSLADRGLVAERRMEHAFVRSWHPYDDVHSWFWPKGVADPEERTGHQLILFAINRETGAPRLFLQQCLENDRGDKVKSSKLKSGKVSLDLDFPASGTPLSLRSAKSCSSWFPVPQDYARLLLIASPGMEGLEFTLQSESGVRQDGEFSGQEFEASLEAIEVFRCWDSLTGDE